MTSILHRLFNELGYNKENGLFILEEDEDKILNVFPSRVVAYPTMIILFRFFTSIFLKINNDKSIRHSE